MKRALALAKLEPDHAGARVLGHVRQCFLHDLEAQRRVRRGQGAETGDAADGRTEAGPGPERGDVLLELRHQSDARAGFAVPEFTGLAAHGIERLVDDHAQLARLGLDRLVGQDLARQSIETPANGRELLRQPLVEPAREFDALRTRGALRRTVQATQLSERTVAVADEARIPPNDHRREPDDRGTEHAIERAFPEGRRGRGCQEADHHRDHESGRREYRRPKPGHPHAREDREDIEEAVRDIVGSLEVDEKRAGADRDGNQRVQLKWPTGRWRGRFRFRHESARKSAGASPETRTDDPSAGTLLPSRCSES